ncbi:hypothetical protein Achl_0722 [Pseudarthrobacter chlorophenolicus A6]|uniref:Uncharacterized protein n=1 Tax=Pseudarthrobacter chlorophenolicus (strain ATCC 700700 / DSM 12829 / CIP 107037 / JCM 12360 / KCTC 9906 / NCIMB 13794 / A6) TaxID=452863 RepID=B8HC09_PSECP|nr:hypothetical protein Achl_0722 [Pseudarthrobacter chlorophenolicus A6]SDQ43016.1 hypothetical protein SAMN04489738_0805 [Pseudarthrobacter chlorophenolicus]
MVLGTSSLAAGAMASLLCLAIALAVTNGGNWFLPMFLATLIWGAVPATVLAFCLGAPLGVLLQPVRNQWLHVAAFGGLGALLGLSLGAFTSRPWSSSDPAYLLSAALMMGGSLAIGRLAVWRLVRVDPEGRQAHLSA